MANNYRFLVFGGTGAIGGAVVDSALKRGWTVISASRVPRAMEGVASITVDPFGEVACEAELKKHGPYDAICWAQGANLSDNVFNVDINQHLSVYKANCLFVISTLKTLLVHKLLARSSRLCVISSIWQIRARQDKLSYSVSKAALQGLVLSASADIAQDGHLINAVLPGALDTPMTRSQLTSVQVEKLKSATKFAILPSIDDVSSLVMFLCSRDNAGITGQFIKVDYGMTNVYLV